MRGKTKRRGALGLALLVGVLTAPAFAGSGRRVEVEGERVLFGDVVSSAPQEMAGLDLGPAPRPGKSMVFRRAQIVRRLKEAMLGTRGLRIPSRITVVRPAQVVSELALQELVDRELPRFLKGDVEVRSMRVRGGVVLPRGPLSLWAPEQTLRGGRQSIVATVRAGQSKGRRVQVAVETARVNRNSTVVVKRGAEVVVEVRANGVRIRAKGIAQQDGRVGQRIAVLPQDGRRLIRGRVGPGGVVEVSL